jgi:hypothetical protein
VARPLAFAFALALVAFAAWVARSLLDLAAGPEVALEAALKETEREGLTLVVPGSQQPLVSRKHHFDRITGHIDRGRGKAYALCTLDFVGSLGPSTVSSLGVERVPFQYRGRRWYPTEGFAPRLTAIVAALEARRQGLESGDPVKLRSLVEPAEAQEPEIRPALTHSGRGHYRALAWFIRAERDQAVVTEQYQLSGTEIDRPVEEKGERRLTLLRRGPRFLFSGSLL